MSEISDMIQRLCPDGVEYKKLISVAKVQYGYPFDAKLFTDDDTYIPLIRIRDVKSGKSSTYYSGAIMSEYIIHDGDILVGMDGEFNLGRWKDRASLLNQRVCKIASLDSDIVLNGFLFHLLSPLFKKIEESITGSTVKHLSAKVINDIEIPVPPLEVQRKIGEVLDNFSELTAELTAELEARRKQYEYYRDNLLNFNREGQNVSDVKWMKLGEVGTFVRGGIIQKTDFVDDGYGCIHYGQIYTHFRTSATETLTSITKELWNKCNRAKRGDLVITLTSENVDDVCKSVAWLGNEEIGISGHAVIFSHKQNSKYLAYYTQTPYFFNQKRKFAHGTKVIEISPDQIAKIEVPIPPLAEQERIVSILDRFEALTTDLTSGLPAEIKARQQQYEYYRDTLLSFPRKSSNS